MGHLRLLRVAHTQQRPSLVEKHHQYQNHHLLFFVTQNIQKISKIKIFYLLGEPYLFIVLPIKQKLAFMAFFSTIPSFFKKTADFFSLWRLFIRSKKRKQHLFDLKSIFFCLYVFFNL